MATASPLAAALIGGNETNTLGLDPALFEANADVQLGQGMQQQGLSTAPAYAPQALARLAQAISGTYVRQQGINDLGKAVAGGVEGLKQIFGPDTVIGRGLDSKSPLARMYAMQAAQKAMIFSGQYENVAPEHQIMMAGGGGPTGQGSAAQAGAVAAAQARARAPYEGGGEGIVQTPNGPREIPLTAATRAGMQPGAQGGSVPQGPPRLAPSPQPPPTRAPAPAPVVAPTAAPTPSAATPSPSPPAPAGALKDQGRVPQAAIPGTASGKPLPNAGAEHLVSEDAKEVGQDRLKAQQTQADMANVRMIQDFTPRVQTGWGAENKLEAARILKSLGVSQATIDKDISVLPDVGAGQILQKKFLELSAGAARGMGAREPGSVISMFTKAYPNLGTDPEAVRLQTNAIYMAGLRAQHLAQEKTNYLNESVNGLPSTGQYRGLKGFNEQFNKDHPPEYYLHAAESMSGAKEPWARIKEPNQQQQIINLIPSGSHFMGPDGKMYVKP